ncbi:fibronectin type III domain-containing protein [Candidatus Woesearchaeota archaeon]|nr:fibronectin type III domain-containing protein [Candidatus Woesearchaeota archaeon]
MKNPFYRGSALVIFLSLIVLALVLAAPSEDEGKTTLISDHGKAYKVQENPTIDFDYERGFDPIKYVIQIFSDPREAKLTKDGKEIAADIRVEKTAYGKYSVEIPKPRQFKPGLYTVTLTNDGETIEQDFLWGVLAINTHKSIYLPGEEAFIAMAVLDDGGRMVCDADVTLEITNPSGIKSTLSTGEGTIVVSPTCHYYSVTDMPDYYSYYTMQEAGTYQVVLTAITKNGERTLTDNFFVQETVDYDVSRKGPTRIYPRDIYTMEFTITPGRAYSGVIREYVPASFKIMPQEGLSVMTVGDLKVLEWRTSLSQGQSQVLSYDFDAPDISPYFFTLGKLEIGNWQEARDWMIASDAVYVVNYTGDDTWSAPEGIAWAFIECWGGGGGGGGSNAGKTNFGGGGGAGGQYAASNITNLPAGNYAIVVGSAGAAGLAAGGNGGAGGNSTFNGSTVKAVGGAGGIANAGAGGTGENSTGIGQIVYRGGSGYTGGASGGAGGGGAGSSGAGGDATGVGTNPGSGTAEFGGAGGNGGADADGSPGSDYGGGGGGGETGPSGGSGTPMAGGAGAQGYVRITYMIADAADEEAPTVTINTGLNNTVFTTRTPTFDYTFSDSISEYANCTLYINDTARNTTLNVANGTATKYLTANTSLVDSNYSVYINCTDASGNVGMSGVLRVAVDATAPAITGVLNHSITDTFAMINWTTDQIANGSVKYGTGLDMSTGTVIHTSLLSAHNISLAGLSASTLYYYNITSCDAHGNCNMTGPYNFTTTAAPDNTPPTVNINAGLNNTVFTTRTPTFDYNFNDTTSSVANCTLFINDTARNTTLNVVNGTSTKYLTSDSSLVDSNYSVYINCTDASGNIGKSDVLRVAVDATAPAITGVLNHSITSSFAMVNWTTSELANGSVKYGTGLDMGTGTVVHTNLLTAHNISLSGLGSTTFYYYNITSCDPHGWCNITGPYNFTTSTGPDTTAPTVSINTSLDNFWTNDNTPEVQYYFTDSRSSTANCTLYFDDAVYNYTASVANGTAWKAMIANNSLPDKNYSVYVNCTDNSSNIGKSSVVHIIVDTALPGVRAITPITANWSSTATPNFIFNFTDSSSSTANCTLYVGTSSRGNNASTINITATTITSSSLSAGTYSWNVTCIDMAGNSNGSTARTITIDSSAPTVTPSSPGDNEWTTDTTPDFVFTTTDSLDNLLNCTLWVDGTSYANNASTINNTATTLTASPALSEASHSWAVNCTDDASNTGHTTARTIYIDNTASTVNINITQNGSAFGTSTPIIGFNFSDSVSTTANCSLYFNNTKYNHTNNMNVNTQYSLLVNTSLTDSNYTVYINCSDKAGKIGKSGVLTVEIDTRAPAITSVNNNSITTSTARVNWTTNEEANGSVKYGTSLAMSDGTSVHTNLLALHNVSLSGLSSETVYYYNITSCDASSNCNITGPYNFTTASGATPDTTAPTVNINALLDNIFTTDTTPDVDFNFTDSRSSTANCTLYFDDTGRNHTSGIANNSQKTLTANATLSDKNYSVYVNCTDNSSNIGKSSVIRIILDTTAPTVRINATLNNTIIASYTPSFDFNFTDGLSPSANCTLYVNGTGYDYVASLANFTQDTLTANASVQNGNYFVNINCTDRAGRVGKSGTLNITIYVASYVITNPPADTKFVLTNDTGTDITSIGQTGIINVLAGKYAGSGNYSAILIFNFSEDIDTTNLVLDINLSSRKSLFHNSSTITGLINISLLIPNVRNTNKVYICPGATSLEQVNASCPGVINISVGQESNGMTVSSVSYDGEDYYLVTNITGTGGGEPDPTSPLQCVFVQDTTCPAGTAKLIGLKNDSGGYINAHAQNKTIETYPYSLCCNSTNASITISTDCPGDDTVIRLSNQTNAHVELGNLSNYSYTACIGSDWKKANCEYPTSSCAENYACIMSIASSEGDNQTNAHVGACLTYDQKVCCALTNFAPPAPTLVSPDDDNTTVFDRRVNFVWSSPGADPDGDTVDYTLNASCGGCSAGCYEPSISDISTANYTVPNALCVDVDYNWTVSACDTYDSCNTSTQFTFRITSVADMILTVNATSFGDMALGENNDTEDDSPAPMVARNVGNVLLNVTINATNLFSTVDMNAYNFQFKADDEPEPGSYEISCSQDSAFAFMSNVTPKTLFCNLSYVDANDESQIEYNVTVPISEPPGAKSSSIEVSFVKSE